LKILNKNTKLSKKIKNVLDKYNQERGYLIASEKRKELGIRNYLKLLF